MKRLKILFLILSLMTLNLFAQIPPIEPGVSQTLAKWRAANYRDVRYKLNITLEKKSPVLKGAMEISVLNDADIIVLDWRRIRGKEELSKISNLSVNGRPAEFEELNEHLILKEGVLKGKTNLIRFDFTSPIAASGSAVTRYVDKEDGAEYVYSLFVPSDASTAFPVFDQPDLKARFSLFANIPSKWKIVSNTDSGTRSMRDPMSAYAQYLFPETRPISTYVFAFAAGEFMEFSDMSNIPPVKTSPAGSKVIYEPFRDPKASKIYVRKSQAAKFQPHAKEVFRLNREGVKFLENYFDYKFPFQKYDLVLIPEFPFGGMEHAGATFLRESSVIFPQEPTKNDLVSRANLIFHEAAHQWFGDTVTMKWFDDLWLKEGFAEFMAYKTLERVMPEYDAWKIFYERNKQAAYLTDSTRGTTPIYQEIPNLSAAKSAYGNIVYRKAPSFLKQAEFYLGEKEFQTAVRAFLKKHEFKNAEWTDLLSEFQKQSSRVSVRDFSEAWVKQRGLFKVALAKDDSLNSAQYKFALTAKAQHSIDRNAERVMKFKVLVINEDGTRVVQDFNLNPLRSSARDIISLSKNPALVFPNYQDYGYGIFLLDERSRAYVLENIQTEKDDFLRTMMWGSLWDSVRETELAPADYVRLVIKNLNVEADESTIQTLLGSVSTAMNYYLSDAQRAEFAPQIETLLIGKMQNAPTLGLRITFYRAFLNSVSTENARTILKDVLSGKSVIKDLKLKTKDKFDIATRLLIVNDNEAPKILAELEKTETSDEAKRYAYAARAGIATAENKARFWTDFVSNKEISESWIEAAFAPFNSTRHAELTLPFLEKALAELPNLKRTRKIFFVNGWLAAFIGGQKSEQALSIINKFLADNPDLDRDLRLKILENADGLERSVRIRAKYAK
jgi:aminopeptidase N